MGSRTAGRLPLLLFLLLVPALRASAQEQRAFLDLVVNGVPKGDALVVLREDDALVSVDRLEEAGLRAFDGRRERADGGELVSLASLAPRVAYEVDERALQIALTVEPALLARTVHDLQPGAPAGLEYRSAPSGFLNYSITTDGREYDVFAESAVHAAGGTFYTTATMTPRGAVRGLTNLTFDDRPRLRRWIVGDDFVGGTPLGGHGVITGVSVGRDFSLAPYYVRYPTLNMSTPILTPSVVEVHVNGHLVREERVQPGQLDLHNLPLTTGHNDARVVVRDPFGGTRELSTTYYLTASVLARGMHDYQYALGWRRSGFGITSWDYASPALFARHRFGVGDWMTAGGRVEVERGYVSAGPVVNVRLPFGELEAAGSASRTPAASGAAALLSYVYASRWSSVGASLRHTGGGYAVSGEAPGQAPRRVLNMFTSVPLPGAMSIGVQHGEELGGEASRRRTALNGSMRLYRSADLSATVTRVTGPERAGTEVSVGVTMTFGSRTVASTSAVRGPEGTQVLMDVQQPLPAGTGVGYQVRGGAGLRNASSAVLQYQGTYGRYEVRRELLGGAGHTSVQAAGALVGIGGGVYATRPVRNSFALVRVPGVDGVRAYSSHQEVGRTNGDGNLLIPDLLPYYGNELSIADTDIPIEYVVPDVDVTLAPPYRGGAVVLFPVRRIQRVTGAVLVVSGRGEQPPAFGELAVVADGTRTSSPIGVRGEFYFENLAPGPHDAEVTFDEGSCAFVLEIPESAAADVDLGTIRCTSGEAR